MKAGLRERVELLMRELHEQARISLPATSMEQAVSRRNVGLLNQFLDTDDREEIDLHLLRKEVAKDLLEARGSSTADGRPSPRP
ncbi:hypothetical protein JVX98_25680 [Ensifer sp. PDNC004]|uniref:hypothetical protein n=1 Tax=Ensifer sp. PDNC004 TaxID=2811423 RepID=UPI00196646AE|nr:hypothetical protein [Ensifer sp. PDNC004]QRY67703.1 hypothetical protein JVX98_25680 [Ensifer sp. PDNC004]